MRRSKPRRSSVRTWSARCGRLGDPRPSSALSFLYGWVTLHNDAQRPEIPPPPSKAVDVEQTLYVTAARRPPGPIDWCNLDIWPPVPPDQHQHQHLHHLLLVHVNITHLCCTCWFKSNICRVVSCHFEKSPVKKTFQCNNRKCFHTSTPPRTSLTLAFSPFHPVVIPQLCVRSDADKVLRSNSKKEKRNQCQRDNSLTLASGSLGLSQGWRNHHIAVIQVIDLGSCYFIRVDRKQNTTHFPKWRCWVL